MFCFGYWKFLGTTGVSRRPALFNVFRHKPKPEPARVVEKKPSFLRNFKAAFQVIHAINCMKIFVYGT